MDGVKLRGMNWLTFVLRWFHLVAAITAVGGTIFMRFALVPSIGVVSDEQRKLLYEQIRRRWAILVMASIAFLLISGVWNFVSFMHEAKSELPEWEAWRHSYMMLYNALFGIKFLLAMVIFFIASALAGRSAGTQKIRDRAVYAMTLNLVLALIVVALAGIMRLTHTGPTPPSTPLAAGMGSGNG
jgi:uncharacterized membrane protein